MRDAAHVDAHACMEALEEGHQGDEQRRDERVADYDLLPY